MSKTHRSSALAVLVLAMLLGLLLAAAPAALAGATFVALTGTESWAQEPTMPEVRATGNVAHLEFGNTFQVYWGEGIPLSYTTTHVKGVAALVDGMPTDAVISGTFDSVNAALGAWHGTFTGTMDMIGMTWSISGRAKGVGGAATGLLMSFTEEGGGAEWPLTVTILYPHGM